MRVVHKKTNKVLGANVKEAKTFIDRLRGLMFMDEMKGMDGLMLDPCRSIHNCFVRFPIDVIFLTGDNKVVKVIKNFKPWRFSWIYFSAQKTLELPAGTLTDEVQKNDVLEVV
jgi:uncharacterized membrane protein (UPF0127 family)